MEREPRINGSKDDQESKDVRTPELREREGVPRLETYMVFIRHGKSETLEGADTDESIDAQRHLTPEGRQQVTDAGIRFANECKLRPNDVVLQRASDRVRAVETIQGAMQGFLKTERDAGIPVDELPVGGIPKKARQRGNATAQTPGRLSRPELSFPSATSNAYDVGGKRRGSTSGLSEEWTRHPELFQQDIDAAGLDVDAVAEQLGMRDSFQNVAATAQRASRVLEKRWDARRRGGTEGDAPRLILMIGSHGFVTEPWLQKVVQQHEAATGKPVRLELKYGEYFVLHTPANPKEPVTLRIGDETIPVDDQYLKPIYAVAEEQQ